MPLDPYPKQEAYAANLKGDPMGMAVYQPIQLRREIPVGRVGDIAFFDNEGGYIWVSNAFCSEEFGFR